MDNNHNNNVDSPRFVHGPNGLLLKESAQELIWAQRTLGHLFYDVFDSGYTIDGHDYVRPVCLEEEEYIKKALYIITAYFNF